MSSARETVQPYGSQAVANTVSDQTQYQNPPVSRNPFRQASNGVANYSRPQPWDSQNTENAANAPKADSRLVIDTLEAEPFISRDPYGGSGQSSRHGSAPSLLTPTRRASSPTLGSRPAQSANRKSYNPFASETEEVEDQPPAYNEKKSGSSSRSRHASASEEKERQRRHEARRRAHERSEGHRSERDRSDRDRSDRDRSDRSRRTHDERYRRERSDRTRGERGERSERRSGRHRSKSDSNVKRTKDGRPLDVIDKMDVTGMFGPGSFHHDGPFDACNPSRNKLAGKAPVAAFDADGPNNSLAVVDKSLKKYMQENSVWGRDEYAGAGAGPSSSDQAKGRSRSGNASSDAAMVRGVAGNPPQGVPQIRFANGGASLSSTPSTTTISQFDTHAKAQVVHGPPTMGLGSSTFVDGTVASKDAIEESAREKAASSLGRSKSLLKRATSRAGHNHAEKERAVPTRNYSGSPQPVRVNLSESSSSEPTGQPIQRAQSPKDSSNRSASPSTGGLLNRVKSLRIRP